MRKSFLFLLGTLFVSATFAQTKSGSTTQSADSLKPSYNRYLLDRGFVQAGFDVTLQKPYNHPFKESIPKGTSIGVDAAIGTWFTPEIGVRARMNWENGIKLFENKKLEWLAPFDEPGVNMQKGGYVSLVGDIMFDLHNIIAGYRPDRFWNAQLYLRAGGVHNFGCDKGSPLIGLGWGNTFRINNQLSLYADVAYNGVSSGFTMSRSTYTGVGTGSNMYFDANLGLHYNIGRALSCEVYDYPYHNTFRDRSLYRNWFVQTGIDMTLYNVRKKDFSQVFTHGRTWGVDAAIGKWFSPVVGARGKLNWENAIIKTSSQEWLPYDKEKDKSCYDGGGCMIMSFDILLSAKHLLMGYVPHPKWDTYIFGRMGLGSNRSIDSMSPIVGAGLGFTHTLTEHLSLYAESAYEGITSEFFQGKDSEALNSRSGDAFNGIWDFNVGLQINLGSMW